MNYSPRVILIRHGETDESLQNTIRTPIESFSDKLNARGRQQAILTAQYLVRYVQLANVFTSPASRAVETAHIISDYTDSKIQVETGLEEVTIGNLAGVNQNERNKLWRKCVDSWVNDPDFALLGGESLNRAARRFVNTITRILGAHEQERIIIISHQGVMAFGLSMLVESSPQLWPHYQCANCSITEISLEPTPRVVQKNYTEHLQSVGANTWATSH